MIAKKDSLEPHSSEQLPNSRRVYVPGRIHPDIRVPMREITLTGTKSYTGAVTPNAPVRVYDCSGPWGDPAFTGTVEEGLPALRRDWILKRGDVEEYKGREVQPIDDGYLSETNEALVQSLAGLHAVTPDQVLAAAKHVLQERQSVTGILLPKPTS